MQPADIRSLTEAYQGIYEEKVELTEELLDETFDELVDELVEEGYEEEEALSLLEDATDAYLEEAKVTFGHDTTARRASGAPVGARRKYGKRKAGEVMKAAGSAVKGAVDSAKKKASAAKAGAQIAGSIAKDEARRAGRKAALAVTSAPGKAKAAVDRKKRETKRGIKGFIKRQAEKVVKRMSEGYDEPKMHSAVKRVMTTQPAAKGRAASRLHSKYSMRSKGNTAGETDGPGPNAPKRSGRKGRGAETDRGSGNAAKRRMSEGIEALKASGLFSEQELAKIAEQMTTVTSVPPAGDSFRTGSNAAPKPPTLPAPKKKPEPKLGAGVPGFKYGGATGP